MTIIITPGYHQTVEREFLGRHPDAFCSQLAATLVTRLAQECSLLGLDREQSQKNVDEFRADIGVYAVPLSTIGKPVPRPTPIQLTVGGHIRLPKEVKLEEVVRETTLDMLKRGGYFRHGDFSPESTDVITAISSQSPSLNGITHENKFSDACRVVGHYLANGYGMQGTFPALAVAQHLDREIRTFVDGHSDASDFLRPDGKVHVTGKYSSSGFQATQVVISLAHGEGAFPEPLRQEIIQELQSQLAPYHLAPEIFSINVGGDFSSYFLRADHGLSKAKDDVVITGGLTEIGTDGVWGKCLFKSSSILLPYVFALAQVVAKTTQARFATVSARSEHGQSCCYLQVEEVDPELRGARRGINQALEKLPRDRDAIRSIMGMPVALKTYRQFNDLEGFHSADKPWKTVPANLYAAFDEGYRRAA